MKKVYSFIIIITFLFIICVTPVIGSEDWVEYWNSGDGTVLLYNRGNIGKSVEKGIVQVWEKLVYSDKGREKEIKRRRDYGQSTEGWDKLLYVVYLSEIDCKKKKSNILSMTDYDTDGNVLSSFSVDKPKWRYIVPDSREDDLRNKVCPK